MGKVWKVLGMLLVGNAMAFGGEIRQEDGEKEFVCIKENIAKVCCPGYCEGKKHGEGNEFWNTCVKNIGCEHYKNSGFGNCDCK